MPPLKNCAKSSLNSQAGGMTTLPVFTLREQAFYKFSVSLTKGIVNFRWAVIEA